MQAVKWYRKAADQNDATAQFNLGLCYVKSEGVDKDFVEAAKWFRKAAGQNDAQAQHILGMFYKNGDGVDKNFVEAYAWFDLAANAIDAAANFRNGLEKQMSQQQIADAQKRSKELRVEVEKRLADAGNK